MSERRVIDCGALMDLSDRTPGLLRIVHRWCRLNGIKPIDVPVPSEMVIEDSAYGPVIRYEAYLTTDDGRRYLDPDDPNRAAIAYRTARLQLAPPERWFGSEPRP
jgi:hypothetical protein